MEKVIILKGAGGRGKTPTLNLLIDLLIKKGATIVYNEDYSDDITKDCFVILDIPDFGRTGVITYGDSGCENAVSNSLNICLEQDCRAVVGASHMRYNTKNITVYKILWDFGVAQNAKTVETTTIIKADGWGQTLDETQVNEICAENLLNLLLKL
ncbi:MAG: hypothetical protein K2I56_07720 [Muribaculaceae bacterium]|nr:hypothetical protein [Muribaculaceae bacterium]